MAYLIVVVAWLFTLGGVIRFGVVGGGLTQRLLILIFSLLTIFLVAETGFRVRHVWLRRIPFFSSTFGEHPTFGWIGKETRFSGAAGRPTILFLGDSYTEGLSVAPNEMYFAVVGRRLNAGVIAYGGLGYGTVQELLVMRELLHGDQAKPALIVLQLCTNDLINNSYLLERRSFSQNALMMRPYLEEGVIVYRFPGAFPAVTAAVDRHSRFIHFIIVRIRMLFASMARAGLLAAATEERIKREGQSFASYRQSIAATQQLLLLIKKEAGNIPVVAFLVDDTMPEQVDLVEALRSAGIPTLATIPETLRSIARTGAVTLADRAHYNERGNEVIGVELAKWISQHGWLDLGDRTR